MNSLGMLLKDIKRLSKILDMKRYKPAAVCFALLLALPYVSRAQEVAEGGIFSGVNRGGLATRFDEYDNRTGAQGGMWLKVGSKWIQGEGALEYSFRGFKYNQGVRVGSVFDDTYCHDWQCRVTSTSHHLSLPLSVAVGYWPLMEKRDYEGVGITISGGGYIDFGIVGATKAKVEYAYMEGNSIMGDYTPGSVKAGLYGDLPHQLKRFDYGWSVGMMFGAGAGFRIGASYRQGLANLSNLDGYKAYNRCFLVNLMLSFNCFD